MGGPVLGGLAWTLLVPPVNLALLAALGLVLHRRRLGRLVARVSVGLLVALALPVVADTLIVLLEQDLPASTPLAPVAPAAIVVLGGDVNDAADGAGEPSLGDPTFGDTSFRDTSSGDRSFGDPGPFTLERLREAAALARRTGLPLLVSGGVVSTGAAPVAVVMADSLRRDFGLAARWIEPDSPTTWENARDSAALLGRAGVTSVLVVTHAWHMRRALIAFRAAGLVAIPAPVRRDAAPRLRWGGLLPRASAWARSGYALHEWIGCAWYAVREAAGW